MFLETASNIPVHGKWKGECYSIKNTGLEESEGVHSITYKLFCDFKQVFSEPQFNHSTTVRLCEDQMRVCERTLKAKKHVGAIG